MPKPTASLNPLIQSKSQTSRPAVRRKKNPVKCDECGGVFAGDLNRHKRTHRPADIHCDGACPRMFRQTCNMRAHLFRACVGPLAPPRAKRLKTAKAKAKAKK